MTKEKYISWIYKETKGDEISLALQLRIDVKEAKNTIAIELLTETGDKRIVGETYFKAAKAIIESCK